MHESFGEEQRFHKESSKIMQEHSTHEGALKKSKNDEIVI